MRMENISLELIISSFIAGMVMFIAPCTLPLVPAFLGFISGVSLEDDAFTRHRFRVVSNTLLFVVGFSSVFILLGLSASLLGSFLRAYQPILLRMAGALIIFFGLSLLGIVRVRLFDDTRKSFLARALGVSGRGKSFFIGLAFGAGWTPCAGAITGAILTIAATKGQTFEGAFLLFVFSLGLALPFLVVAFFFSRAIEILRKFTRVFLWFYRGSGIVLIFLGILLVSNSFTLLIRWGFSLFPFIEYQDALIPFM